MDTGRCRQLHTIGSNTIGYPRNVIVYLVIPYPQLLSFACLLQFFVTYFDLFFHTDYY